MSFLAPVSTSAGAFMFHLSFLWPDEIILEHGCGGERRVWWIYISGIEEEAEERFPNKLSLIVSVSTLVSTSPDCQNCEVVCCHSHSFCSFLVLWIKLRMNPPGAAVLWQRWLSTGQMSVKCLKLNACPCSSGSY